MYKLFSKNRWSQSETSVVAPSLSFFLLFLTLCVPFGCENTEETRIQESLNPIAVSNSADDGATEAEDILSRVESTYQQLNAGKIGIPLNWESTQNTVLKAAYARHLLSRGKIKIPFDWRRIEDGILYAEYKRADLIKQFGDIPQAHIIADFHLRSPLGIKRVTRETFIDYFEAIYFLFPTETHRLALEQVRKPELIRGPDLEVLREENPELWAQQIRYQLVEEHGDIPEVHIVADFIRKLEIQIPRTDMECRDFLIAHRQMRPFKVNEQFHLPLDEQYAILEAQDQLKVKMDELTLNTLEKFREARAKGISFRFIDWVENDGA